jgi:Tfp pilus assembly PilM family ATPase
MSFIHPLKESVACMFDDRSIRFFHVTKKGTDVTIKNFFSEHIPDHIVTDHEQVLPDALLVQRLTSLRKKHNFKKIHVVIPDRYITVFHTIIPRSVFLNDRSKNKRITLQHSIEQYLKKLLADHPNFSPTDTVADYEVIQESDEGYHTHVSIAHPDQFRFIPEILERAGFTVDHIDIASFSIHRFARYMQHGALYGTVAIGTHTTQISVVRSGKIITSTWCQVGSTHLTTTLQSKLGITLRDAERIIREYGILSTHPDKQILAALYETLQPVVVAIEQALMVCSGALYNHSFYKGIPEQWYVYGLGAAVPGIAQYLGIKARATMHPIDIIPTELMDEEVIIQIPVDQLPLYLPVMSTALNYLLE